MNEDDERLLEHSRRRNEIRARVMSALSLLSLEPEMAAELLGKAHQDAVLYANRAKDEPSAH